MSKILYLNGLRGFAAIMVFFDHFRGMFIPNISGYFVNFFCDSSFAVMIFFVLSGFVLSNSFFEEKISESFMFSSIRRYFRLEFPIIFSLIIVYLLSNLSLFYNQQIPRLTDTGWFVTGFSGIPTILEVLFSSFIGVIFLGDFHLNPVLWTMRIEFFGSILIFAILFIFKNKRFGEIKYRFLIYAFAFIFIPVSLFAAFIIGMIICDIKNSQIISNHKSNFNLLYSLIGIFIGSFLITFLGINGFIDYPLLTTKFLVYQRNLLFFMWINSVFWFLRLIGASLVVFAFTNTNVLQYIFSKPIPIFLGKISFSLYILNYIMLCSLSSYLFLIFSNNFSNNISGLFVLVVTLPVTIVIANYVTEYIDIPGIKASKRISLILNRWISHIKFSLFNR